MEQFVAEHPESPWTGSVLFNLGMEYYKTGRYSKALAAWEKAWPLLKDATDPPAKALADETVGELAFMYARVGRMNELSPLLASIEGRVIVGSATELIAGARQGLWTMQHQPEIAFRCGPLALDRILAHQHPPKVDNALVRDSKSTTNGFSLSQVAELSQQLGMNYQMAFRAVGAPLLMPAVVHWKVGHYAALLREENGRYLLQDPTFRNDAWVTKRALEEEASGYFLVARGELPAGWRMVSTSEGNTVWGKGQTFNNDPKATTSNDKKTDDDNCQGGGMPRHHVHLLDVNLNLVDNPVGYSPPIGSRVQFVVTYNQREAVQPAVFTYSNLGPKWNFNWLAFISDNPMTPLADVDYHPPGGGALPFTGFDEGSQTFAPQIKSQALLSRTSTNSYVMVFDDGTKEIFDQPDTEMGTSRNVFLTKIVDPAGNTVQVSYDSNFRIVAVTDAIGQVTTFSYELPGDNLKLTKVTDPFGRFATLEYDTYGRLSRITDCISLVSQFHYNAGDAIQSMTTPYGTTSFFSAEVGRNRVLEVTYPNGEKERVEFATDANVPDQDPGSTLPQGVTFGDLSLSKIATFFWDRRAYPAYAANPNDYSTAHVYNWLHMQDYSTPTGIPRSEKLPLENRVWYGYEGSDGFLVGRSDQPSAIGRVLDDGSTQLWQFRHDLLGHITNSIDPVGRSMTYTYSTNLVDLLEVRRTTGTNNELNARFLYNEQHMRVASWDAAGEMTTNTYNPRGKLLTTTNPNGDTTSFTYDANSYLLSVVGPMQNTNNFSYDAVGRIKTTTVSDGYTLGYTYDNFDRLMNTTYPDGTFQAFTYDRLDRVMAQDRMGRQTLYSYDALRRLVSVQDPLNRITRFEYCGCGSLSGLIDSMGRKTGWEHDIEGRLTAKQYADGSRVSYTYENTTGRLKSICDEKGQFKVYDYNPDNTHLRISYPNANIATPAVTFYYDPNYNRMVMMQDGIGTTTWTYYPAGVLGAPKVATVNGPWANTTVSYQYDSLGRTSSRFINGVPQTFAYDALSRITNVVNALGSFTYDYDGATARLLDAFYPNGQTTHYDYFDNLGDHRLQQITHRKSNSSLISRFSYAYNPFGDITNWVQELGALIETWGVGYDPADQLLSVVANQSDSTTNTFSYSYDPAGNRLSETTNS